MIRQGLVRLVTHLNFNFSVLSTNFRLIYVAKKNCYIIVEFLGHHFNCRLRMHNVTSKAGVVAVQPTAKY